jgi:hypothetical protein
MEAQEEEFCCAKRVIYHWGSLSFSPTLLPNRDNNFHFGINRDALGQKVGCHKILWPLLAHGHTHVSRFTLGRRLITSTW